MELNDLLARRVGLILGVALSSDCTSGALFRLFSEFKINLEAIFVVFVSKSKIDVWKFLKNKNKRLKIREIFVRFKNSEMLNHLTYTYISTIFYYKCYAYLI